MAPVFKILGVPTLPPGGSLGTGKRCTVPKFGLPCRIFSACKWGFYGLASLRKLIIATLDGEANFLLEGCPHLVVLFDSIAGLCFHKKRPFSQSFQPVCLYTFSMSYTLRKQLTELALSPGTSSKAVESIYLTSKIGTFKNIKVNIYRCADDKMTIKTDNC